MNKEYEAMELDDSLLDEVVGGISCATALAEKQGAKQEDNRFGAKQTEKLGGTGARFGAKQTNGVFTRLKVTNMRFGTKQNGTRFGSKMGGKHGTKFDGGSVKPGDLSEKM